MSKPKTTNEKFIEIDGRIKLLNQKIDTIQNNHLKHMQKDIDRLLWGIGMVGFAVVSQFLYIITK
mgnify:FL=1|jgi:hypothetical protein|tara:strand:- start:4844 stop:5038 length:195 start_codon:yes stop_codon:yes gene_type:complete